MKLCSVIASLFGKVYIGSTIVSVANIRLYDTTD